MSLHVDNCGIRVDAYRVMKQAVGEGVTYGWNRAHKHVDDPSDLTIQDEITKAVMNEICEWFHFEEET